MFFKLGIYYVTLVTSIACPPLLLVTGYPLYRIAKDQARGVRVARETIEIIQAQDRRDQAQRDAQRVARYLA